jgi:hypothetical protein
VATFVQSEEDALSFIKDLGLDQDGGYYQKHSEALDKNIKALKESPNHAGLAKKVRNSVAHLIYPDKLEQNDHADAISMAQELRKTIATYGRFSCDSLGPVNTA